MQQVLWSIRGGRTSLRCAVWLRPRVFAFQARQRPFFKLMMAGRVVGQYDNRQSQWRIRRPFYLFVDEAELPHPRPAQGFIRHETPVVVQAD